jgi:hypothetical protein
MASGKQETDIGPAQPNVTATNTMIAEQAHRSVTSSDIDGLDDALTEVAKIGGELAIREFSKQTVERIVGIGAVWPETQKDDYLNSIEFEVVAASSGRPNKAVEIANWERLAPILLNSGANPMAVVKETIKRLDDRIEPADFYPTQPPAVPPMQGPGAATPVGGGNQQRKPVKPRQPLQRNQAQQPVPHPGA